MFSAPGGIIVDEKDSEKPVRTDICVFRWDGDAEKLREFYAVSVCDCFGLKTNLVFLVIFLVFLTASVFFFPMGLNKIVYICYYKAYVILHKATTLSS